ncbi:MAG: PAS domain-containing protein [Mesorhizobium sp.]|nr:MAG: PAS domain-containing protein [Mesorhizobium sp.]
MRPDNPVTSTHTGYALFDASNILVGSNPEMFGSQRLDRGEMQPMDAIAAVAEALSYLKSFDGRPIEPGSAFAESAAARWTQIDKGPVEAETLDGQWKLLTAHPRPGGGVALVSVDITDMKRAQIAHRENAEIFRCITDSHPLPVWVVDAGSGQILYESLDASNLLGRKWTPNEPQFLTDHFVNTGDFNEISSLASNSDIVRDHEIQLRNTSGSTVWCSTNCRRGVYGGHPSLIIGVLDITERKQREDLFGFLIKHHPLPVWMNDASSGELIYQSNAAERLLGWSKKAQRETVRLGDYFVPGNQSGAHAKGRRRKLRGAS